MQKKDKRADTLLDKLQKAGQENFGDKPHKQGLNYQKGNIDQRNKPEPSAVWDSCPVKDEFGQPLGETRAEPDPQHPQ